MTASRVLTIVAVIVAGVAVAGAAATLRVGEADLAAGTALVGVCDDDGFAVELIEFDGTVVGAAVSGIDGPSCDEGSLSLVLLDANGTEIAGGGPAPVPAETGPEDRSVIVSVSPSPATDAVDLARVWIVGP